MKSTVAPSCDVLFKKTLMVMTQVAFHQGEKKQGTNDYETLKFANLYNSLPSLGVIAK